MKKLSLSAAAWLLLLGSGLAAAQGDGGSQTACELQFSTCKQTAKADYQFCKNAKGKSCRPNLNDAMKGCSTARNSCQLAAGAQG